MQLKSNNFPRFKNLATGQVIYARNMVVAHLTFLSLAAKRNQAIPKRSSIVAIDGTGLPIIKTNNHEAFEAD